jgi:hypothetical protein
MIPKKEIIEAMQGSKVGDMTVGEIANKLKPSISELSIRCGESKGDEYIYQTSQLVAKCLKSDYSRLYFLEVILSLDFCGRGLTSEIKGVNSFAILSALKFYLNSEERHTAKTESENKAVGLLPEKCAWTNEDHLNAMRKRYRENMERVRNGSDVVDLGGLLFEHLEKLGFVEICDEDYEAVTDVLIKKKKANPFDLEVRRCLSSEEIKKVLARQHALNSYFKLEIAMRDEAKKIQANGN